MRGGCGWQRWDRSGRQARNRKWEGGMCALTRAKQPSVMISRLKEEVPNGNDGKEAGLRALLVGSKEGTLTRVKRGQHCRGYAREHGSKWVGDDRVVRVRKALTRIRQDTAPERAGPLVGG